MNSDNTKFTFLFIYNHSSDSISPCLLNNSVTYLFGETKYPERFAADTPYDHAVNDKIPSHHPWTAIFNEKIN